MQAELLVREMGAEVASAIQFARHLGYISIPILSEGRNMNWNNCLYILICTAKKIVLFYIYSYLEIFNIESLNPFKSAQ